MATIKEVAALARVSSATVSHVINETRYVSLAVREQVLAAMEALDYRPNALARSLRSGQTHTLGLVLPDSANPFFAEVGREIEIAAFKAGYSVILCNTDNDIDKEAIYLDVLIEKQVDGMIFVATGERRDSVEKLLEIGLPVVVLDRDFPDLELDVVLADNYQGGLLATQHLIGFGHRRIGCISGPSHVTPSAQRVTGYRQALEEAGLAFDPALIQPGDFHPQTGWEAAHKLLSAADPPTAIFAANDLMAMGALRAAAELGRRIPQDLALVGYDDIELASYTSPPLTTIKQPTQEMAVTALDFVLTRFSAKSAPRQRAFLPISLTQRGSCGGA